MATLKNMTRVGADVRQIARLLQAKAPENHMLAYITPEEAQLLKDRGGSGMPDPETGIPSFQEEFTYDMYGEKATAQPYVPQYETNTPVFDYNPTALFTSGQPAQVQAPQAAPVFDTTSFMAAPQVAPQPLPEINIGQFYLKLGLKYANSFVDDENKNANMVAINIAEIDNKMVFTGLTNELMCRAS